MNWPMDVFWASLEDVYALAMERAGAEDKSGDLDRRAKANDEHRTWGEYGPWHP